MTKQELGHILIPACGEMEVAPVIRVSAFLVCEVERGCERRLGQVSWHTVRPKMSVCLMLSNDAGVHTEAPVPVEQWPRKSGAAAAQGHKH